MFELPGVITQDLLLLWGFVWLIGLDLIVLQCQILDVVVELARTFL